MGNPGQNGFTLVRENFSLIAVGAFGYLVLLFLALSSYQIYLLLILGFAITVGIAFRFPMTTVVALLITAVFPTIYQMTPIFDENYGAVGGGLNAVDIVLVGMAGASALQAWKSRRLKEDSLGLGRLVLLFALWMLFEIVRNVSVYGISAPGEFRHRYLILVLPLYVGLFFCTARERRKLFRLLAFSCLTLTFLSVPIIGTLKGWSLPTIGPQAARYLGSHITLGLVYALVMLFLAQRHHYMKANRTPLWITTIPVVFMVLIDSHRSVWLVSVIILISLVWLKEIQIRRFWRWGIPAALIVIIVWFTATEAGLDVVNFISTRGIAFVNPEEDETSAWRLAQWETQIANFYSSPITGEGFGAHFGLSGWKGDVGISPHSLYVQTLVKIGIVGMFLYLVIVFKLLSAFKHWIKSQRGQGNSEISLVLAAFVIIIGAHAYYVAYAFEYYTWLFVGLGVAVVRSAPGVHSNGE